MYNNISLSKLTLADQYSIHTEEFETEVVEEVEEQEPIESSELSHIEKEIEDCEKAQCEYESVKEDLATTAEASETLMEQPDPSEESVREQFEVAQETLLISLGQLGYKKQNLSKLSITYEAGLSPIEKLKLQTEGVKEVILAVIGKIIDVITWIVKKIFKWIAVILNDLTFKKIPFLNKIVMKMTLFDSKMEDLKFYHDVYAELKRRGEVTTEDDEVDPKKQKITNNVKQISKLMDKFVSRYGYLIVGGTLDNSLKECHEYYASRAKSSHSAKSLEDLKKSFRNMRTSIDSKIIKSLSKEDMKEELIVFNFNEKTLSYCYIDNNDKIQHAEDIPHNIDVKGLADKKKEELFKMISSDPTKFVGAFKTLSQVLAKTAKQLTEIIKKDTKRLESESKACLNKSKNNPEDANKDEITNFGNAFKDLLKALAQETLREINDMTNLLIQIDKCAVE